MLLSIEIYLDINGRFESIFQLGCPNTQIIGFKCGCQKITLKVYDFLK